MRKLSSLLLLSLFAVAACDDAFQVWQPIKATDGMPSDAGGCVQPDMVAPVAKCAAAKGLAGDNLFCIDFNSIPNQILTNQPPTQLASWFFSKDTMGKDCWEISNGKLQIYDFTNFKSTCTSLIPALKDSDFSKYGKFELSIIQKLSIRKSEQLAEIYLGQTAIDTRQMWAGTGTGLNPRQINTITFSKSEHPSIGAYQLLLQITSGNTNGLTGWQIESIAINGSP